jgi:hypothetical protein
MIEAHEAHLNDTKKCTDPGVREGTIATGEEEDD